MNSAPLDFPVGGLAAPCARWALASGALWLIGLSACDRAAEHANQPPNDTSSPAPWLREEAQERGLVFQHRSGARPGRYWMPEIMGGGAALADLDNDGDLDAYLVQSGAVDQPAQERAPNQLFENQGQGRFRDVSAGSGAEDRGYGNGVACGDVDGDGDVDLYVTNWGPNALLENRSQGRLVFADVTAERGGGDGGWGTSAAFFDRDLDGDLDLYVCNYLSWSPGTEMPCVNVLGARDYCSPQNYEAAALDVLYDNQNGQLVERGRELGIDRVGTGLGVLSSDFNGDGWPDLFVANDGLPNLLWRNDGRGAFSNVATETGVAVDADGVPKAGMGVAAADVDGDGQEDLLVVNLNREADSLHLNRGGRFSDATRRAGLALVSRPLTRFGVGFYDFDQDGRLDLFQACGRVQRQELSLSDDPYAEPNLLFSGQPNLRFEEVLPRGGTAELLVASSRAAAFGDVDGDGAIDILLVNRDGPAHLLMNRVPQRGAWIGLSCVGANGVDVLGARVNGQIAGQPFVRHVRAAASYQASNEARIHIGLGSHTGVEELSVTWPDGSVEAFGSRPAGANHKLVRGQGQRR
jgi:hypothetical protein